MTKDGTKLSKQTKDITCVEDGEENVHVVSVTGQGVDAVEPHCSKRHKGNICTAPTTAGAVITTTQPEVTKVNTTFTTTTTTTKHSGSTANPSRPATTCDLSFCHTSGHPSTTGDDSVGQMNTPEMLSLPKNCILQRVLHLQLLAKVSKASLFNTKSPHHSFPHSLLHSLTLS